MISDSAANAKKNELHYDKVYADVDVDNTIKKLRDLDTYLDSATRTHTSWVGLYKDNFRKELKGKRVLELGCGDCRNAAVMAALGAEVYANDISSAPGKAIEALNQKFPFEKPLKFVYGDFLESNFPDDYFDIVVGKAFVHHLTVEQEEAFLKVISRILKKDGMVRFFENAINSKLLDNLRWMMPMDTRPSSLSRAKFKAWLDSDPHPHRDNSSRHYREIGKKYFEQVKVVPFGGIERFYRLMPSGNATTKFRRWAFRAERWLPAFLNEPIARSQTITYRFPKK